MTPIEEILRLAREAEVSLKRADSRGIPDIESSGLRIVEVACEHPEMRVEICHTFKHILTKPDEFSWEVLPLVMHSLRWPEMRTWVEDRHGDCITSNNWRGEPVYRHLLGAFKADWVDRDLYETFKQKV